MAATYNFFQKEELIKIAITKLAKSTADDIVKNIPQFLSDFNEKKLEQDLYAPAYVPFWKNLINTHSFLLTQVNLALGEQTPLGQLAPIDQLLGIYYLALSLKADEEYSGSNNQSIYSEETLNFLLKASDHSIQAMLLLRAHYCDALMDATVKIDIDNLKETIRTVLSYKAPGFILYGEILMYMCQHLIKAKSLKDDKASSQIADLFREGMKYCYLGDFLQSISVKEINNAYGVCDGTIPYGTPGIFYQNCSNNIDEFCKSMRTKMNIGVDPGLVKKEAQEEARVLIQSFTKVTQPDLDIELDTPVFR